MPVQMETLIGIKIGKPLSPGRSNGGFLETCVYRFGKLTLRSGTESGKDIR
jgi:hypothetical protein